MYSEDLFIEGFANELRRKREEQSLSFNQLAEKSSVSASFIMRLEKDKRKNASIEVIFKLSNALGIEIGKLVEQSRLE
ncbi:helix-turn-helix domain-containing protein [Ureibacillus endophyticus]|uniref:XRE family transcriptional regulator n=1 Tax=Ureibacillus endophyticus TaxID=1978490 RepID=A0A494Z1P5_9BACL|nr:helix-turn-helix transcriptional regulator [Lysinibacillus endophyticus]RKQ16444.1 XRE family transcriptional regulator [Lysinibacillus endophyticus]